MIRRLLVAVGRRSGRGGGPAYADNVPQGRSLTVGANASWLLGEYRWQQLAGASRAEARASVLDQIEQRRRST